VSPFPAITPVHTCARPLPPPFQFAWVGPWCPQCKTPPDAPNPHPCTLRCSHARFSYNNLGGTFPTEFCEAKMLENLYLSQNGLTGTLPACLSGLTKLKQLYAKDNSLVGA
jgi:hypothetical protein